MEPRLLEFEALPVRTWSQLSNLEQDLNASAGQWIFRGQTNCDWGLQTTLERQLDFSEAGLRSAPRLEGGLLRRFKRQAHQHLSDVPTPDSWLEWLALMQHHGAPTRLLDFTYSFFVGLYFAIEDGRGPYALWAIDSDVIRDLTRELVGSARWKSVERDPNLQKTATFKMLFARPAGRRLPGVLAVNAYRFNHRLAIQQGVFLCQGDVSTPFEENLSALLARDRDGRRALRKYEIHLESNERLEVMQRLFRMNVTRATLFPGLDGFAYSLRWAMQVFPQMLVPDQDWPTK